MSGDVRGVMCAQAFTEEQRAELHAVEAQIKRRLAIGAAVSERKVGGRLAPPMHHSLPCFSCMGCSTPHTAVRHAICRRCERLVSPCAQLREELVRCGMADMLVGRALHYLIQQGDLEAIRGRRMLHRMR